MTNLLAIAAVTVRLTNIQLQLEPDPANPDYYTNGLNASISGQARMSAFVGPNIVRLSWTNSGPTVIQTSSNLSQWQDIRVVFTGSNQWLVWPVERVQFFRIKAQ